MIISCKKATQLISQSMEDPLTPYQKLKLTIHLWICSHCVKFRRESEFFRNIFSYLRESEGDHLNLTSDPQVKILPHEEKEKIKKCLENKKI